MVRAPRYPHVYGGRTGRSGLPEISGRAFWVFYISGFQEYNPYSYSKFRVPAISSLGLGKIRVPAIINHTQEYMTGGHQTKS
jgi:hypothetical protein